MTDTTTDTLTNRQQQIKDEFIEVRKTWGAAWQAVLELDEDFVAAYLAYSAVPWRKQVLDDKVKEFIYLTIDATSTHLFAPGLRPHFEAAVRFGATGAELIQVLELVSTIGLQTLEIGFSALAESADATDGELTPDQQESRRIFEDRFGTWNAGHEQFLRLSPELFAANLLYTQAAGDAGPLEPKVKKLVLIAVHATATHRDVERTRKYVREALALGATPAEIAEVLEITSVVGVHGVLSAAPVLAEVLAEADAAKA